MQWCRLSFGRTEYSFFALYNRGPFKFICAHYCRPFVSTALETAYILSPWNRQCFEGTSLKLMLAEMICFVF